MDTRTLFDDSITLASSPFIPSLSLPLSPSLTVLLSLFLVMALFSSAFCYGCLSLIPASPSPSSLPRVVHSVYYLLSLARTTIQLTAPEQLFILLNPLECPRHCWRCLLLLSSFCSSFCWSYSVYSSC